VQFENIDRAYVRLTVAIMLQCCVCRLWHYVSVLNGAS